MATLFNSLPATPEPYNTARYYGFDAQVTVGVDDAPAVSGPTLRRDRFEVMGDGKVLRVLRVNTDMSDIRDVWKFVRKRAAKIEGATTIRFNGASYNI